MWTAKMDEYAEKITAAENDLILTAVRGYNITPEKLATLLRELNSDESDDDIDESTDVVSDNLIKEENSDE